MRVRPIVIVASDGVQILDLTGPGEVFAIANRFLNAAQLPYEVEVPAGLPGEVVCSGGLRLVATRRLADVEELDTLIIAGGDGVADTLEDDTLLGAISALSSRARRTASVCTGAFLLAGAGLLDGRRATTHWSACELLAQLCPTSTIDPDAIYVRDGNLSTSAEGLRGRSPRRTAGS